MSMLCVIRATRKPMLMVFRATRKRVLWYLEQQENTCFVFRATQKSMLKVIRATRKSMPQFQAPIFLETRDLSQISRQNLKKQKCYLNKRIDWEHILE